MVTWGFCLQGKHKECEARHDFGKYSHVCDCSCHNYNWERVGAELSLK